MQALSFTDRLRHAYNAFVGKEQRQLEYRGPGYSIHPDVVRLTGGNEKTIISAIYNRIALDVAALNIRHVYLDEQGRYTEDIDSGLNTCLTIETNIDQTPRAFIQDLVLTILDKGAAAILIADATEDPELTDSYDIKSLRVAQIVEWFPEDVRVRAYNQQTGQHTERTFSKRQVCIVQNPLYSVINARNSIMQRLIRKLALLDMVDEQNSSGKLDLIIQLPYVIKNSARKDQAEARRKDIEMQLTGSKYGIAYTDGTEKITQLNRPIENGLNEQIKYLMDILYGQLSMTPEILNGTADEQVMNNYYARTIEPFIDAIVSNMRRTFLSKNARTRNQSIVYFRDPFKLVTAETLAKVADTMTRNEIMSSNELRQVIGLRPSSDPKADELRNKNLNQSNEEIHNQPQENYQYGSEEENQNGYY